LDLQQQLLPECRCLKIEERQAWMQNLEFQGGRCPLTLVAGSENLLKPFDADGLAQKVPNSRAQFTTMPLPPAFQSNGIGPGQVFVGIQIHVLIAGIIRGAWGKGFWHLAGQTFRGEVQTGNHGESFACRTGQFRLLRCLNDPGNKTGITEDPRSNNAHAPVAGRRR
jgi:hypothetical protein